MKARDAKISNMCWIHATIRLHHIRAHALFAKLQAKCLSSAFQFSILICQVGSQWLSVLPQLLQLATFFVVHTMLAYSIIQYLF